MKSVCVLILFFFSLFVSYADSYSEVVFDNSLSSGYYAKSTVKYTKGSWVENLNNKLLVSDSHFFTPGNSLSLRYLSAEAGQWDASVLYKRSRNPYKFNLKDQLRLFIYVHSSQTKIEDLPMISVLSNNGEQDTVKLSAYIDSFKVNQWIQVLIPCSVFTKMNKDDIVSSVTFLQGLSSSKEHHLFLDQIEFVSSNLKEVRVNSPAILTDAISYDKMVKLKWQLPLTPNIRYVKLYRSNDGKNFSAIGIRPIYMQSCLDAVPKTGQKYYYKIAWLDNTYKESPSSDIKVVDAKDLKKEAILDLIQASHINYFIENYDVNSGMYTPFRSRDKVIVSTEETGGAILSLLIAAERNQLSRQSVLQRISRITYFLSKAQNLDGFYPAYFDGRKGLPDYDLGSASYDVSATARIIESLLIAREYFNKEDEVEKDLRNRITTLYNNINWGKVTDSNYLLKRKIHFASDIDVPREELPISGANVAINTYLLAISSNKFALPQTSYFDGVYNNYTIVRKDSVLLQNKESQISVVGDTVSVIDSLKTDSLFKESIFFPSIQYGVEVPFSKFEGSLLELYQPFLTIRPSLISDNKVDWKNAITSCVRYVKRRDNELGFAVKNNHIWGYPFCIDSTNIINPILGGASIMVDSEIGESSLLAFYNNYGDYLLTEYGFRAELNLFNSDVFEGFKAVNQSTIAVMIENARTGLIWNLYANIPELKSVRGNMFPSFVPKVE